MKIGETFYFLLIPLAITTCETNDFPCCDNIEDKAFDISIDPNKYYDEEIFPSAYLSVYDTWHLDNISGGFSGGGYARDFDQLVIQKYGIFKIFRNDSLLLYGRIDIDRQDDNGLLINLTADSVLGNVAFSDMTKYVFLSDSALTLYAPCCDRFNYHFVKCGIYSNPAYYQQNPRLDNVLVTLLDVPQDRPFVCLYFSDNSNGYVLCADKTILKTTNGGGSWRIFNIGCDLPLYDMCFTSIDTGFLAGGRASCGGTGCHVPGSIILRTTDGGESWAEMNIPYAWSELHSICFGDNKTGYAVGLGLNVKTTDGGENWIEFNVDSDEVKGDIKFIDENTGFVCGLHGSLFKTVNGGADWTDISVNTNYYLNTVFFADEMNGFIGSYGKLFRTTNGGITWNIAEYSPMGVYTMHFQDKLKGIVFGTRKYTNGNCRVWNSSLNFTEDGGETWKGDSRINDYVLSASYPSGNIFYAIAGGWKIFRIEVR